MKTITELKVQVKDKNRVNLSLDGNYFCALNMETVVKNSLKVGIIIDEKKIEQWQMESEKNFAWNKALKIISTRYKTQKEIYLYLQEKGYLPQIIFYVIDKLNEYHFIDDKRYAESYVSHKISKDGPLKIKQELLAKGVAEEIADEVLNNQETDDVYQTIERLAQKYMKNKEATKENYIKMFKYLQGKGFSYEDIKNVVRNDD